MTNPLASVWQREVPAEPLPVWSGDLGGASTVIVGGGLTAAWLAHQLVHWGWPGADILVLAPDGIADGASGRNGGFVLGGTSDLYGQLVAQVGRRTAWELLQLSQRNQSLIRGVLGADAAVAEYQETGSLYLAAADEADVLASTVAWLREDGVPAEMVSLADLPASLRRLDMAAAAYFPEDGAIQPVRLVHHLVHAAAARGVRFVRGGRVSAVTPKPDGIALSVAGQVVAAQRVVLCTNAWLGELVPSLSGVVRPTRGQVLAAGPCVLDYPYPVYADHGYLYWRPRPDQSLVLGGYRQLDMASEWTDTLRLNPSLQARLTQLAERLAGGPVPITDRWAGIMAFTPDHLPVVGPIVPGLYVAGGYSGHGVALTAAVGDLVARHLATGASLPAMLLPNRFPPAS